MKMLSVGSVQTPRFQLTGFSREKKSELREIIGDLGGVLLSDEFLNDSVSHIVCGKPSRSEKFMGGMALGKWILTSDYLTESRLAGRWVDEAPHEWNTGKVDRVRGLENASSLLMAVTRWRLHIANGGTGAFFGWRAAVLVANPARKSVYKRLLQLGGAAIVEVRLPIRRAPLIARDVSHVFVGSDHIDDVQGLLMNGVLCLNPLYIGIFLMMDPAPEPRDYLISSVPVAAFNNEELSQSRTSSTASSQGNPDGSQSQTVQTKPQTRAALSAKDNIARSASNCKATKRKSTSTTSVTTPTSSPLAKHATRSVLGNSAVLSSPPSSRNTNSQPSQSTLSPGKKARLVQTTLKGVATGLASPTHNCSMWLKHLDVQRSSDSKTPSPHVTPTKRTVSTPVRQSIGSLNKRVIGTLIFTHATTCPAALADAVSQRGCHLPSSLAARPKGLLPDVQSSPLPDTHRSLLPATHPTQLPDTHTSPLSDTHQSVVIQKPSVMGLQDVMGKVETSTTTASKRRKLDLSWSRACPGVVIQHFQERTNKVVLQASNAMTMMFEASLEETQSKEALHVLSAYTSATRYPQPKSLHTAINTLLLEGTSVVQSYETYGVLQRVLSLHPPTTTALQNLYLSAIRGPEIENWPSAWDIINNSIRVVRDADANSQEHLNHWLLLKFLTAVMETDFAVFQCNLAAGSQTNKGHTVRRTLWAQVMWAQGQVGKVNPATRQLFRHLVLAAIVTPRRGFLELLQSMVAMTAQCCHLESSPETSAHVSPQCEFIARELAYIIQGEIGDCAEPLHQLLTSLNLPWLRLLLTQTLLDLYDDSLLTMVPADINRLSLRKIVMHHFYLLPPVSSQLPSSPHCKIISANPGRATRSCKKLLLGPLIIGNSGDNIGIDQKTGKLSPAAVRGALTINKRNTKGETALYRACIKNNVLKTKELLHTTGINVNVADNAGWTPLYGACNNGNIECLVELLKYKPAKTIDSYFTQGGPQQLKRVDMKTNVNGVTPLHAAVINNHVEAARLLLHYGGRSLLATQTWEGKTSLDLALTDVMRDVLSSSSSLSGTPSTPSTPRKRRSFIGGLDDSQNSSQGYSQSQDSSQGQSIDPVMPSEETYQEILSVATTSAQHCLTFVVLLRHLVGSYMTVHQIQRIKAQMRDPTRQCPLDLKDCLHWDSGSSSSHVKCLCRHLTATLTDCEADDLKDDVRVLRQWHEHHVNLKCHLDRISNSKVTVGCPKIQGHLMALSFLGSIK